jgi:hypothetical protein
VCHSLSEARVLLYIEDNAENGYHVLLGVRIIVYREIFCHLFAMKFEASLKKLADELPSVIWSRNLMSLLLSDSSYEYDSTPTSTSCGL